MARLARLMQSSLFVSTSCRMMMMLVSIGTNKKNKQQRTHLDCLHNNQQHGCTSRCQWKLRQVGQVGLHLGNRCRDPQHAADGHPFLDSDQRHSFGCFSSTIHPLIPFVVVVQCQGPKRQNFSGWQLVNTLVFESMSVDRWRPEATTKEALTTSAFTFIRPFSRNVDRARKHTRIPTLVSTKRRLYSS